MEVAYIPSLRNTLLVIDYSEKLILEIFTRKFTILGIDYATDSESDR